LAVLASLLSVNAVAQQAPVLQFLNARNEALVGAASALGVSRSITHDASLPRGFEPDLASPDPENFRIELEDATSRGNVVYARLESWGEDGTRHGLLRHLPLVRVGQSTRFRSPFVRIVADATDSSAPDVGFQLLRARLTDRVLATVLLPKAVSAERYVGGRGAGADARDVLRGRLRILVLRAGRGTPPVLGKNDDEATELARRQVEIANEIWAQCFVDFGEPARTEVQVVDPPLPALLSVSDLDGLPARGDGAVTFLVAGKRVGPVALFAGALPEQTAQRIAHALRALGYDATPSINPRADHGAYPSADVIVRDKKGALLPLGVDPDLALSSDAQQRVAIGGVDLSDGISEFDNTISAVGTLEERTLVKLLADGDPSTIDLLLINRFVNRDRQGEAFIEADGSSMANTLIFDRNAVRFERQAWVQAHELGHVLLDEPLHPDNVGPDRPWLLMDADARQGRVVGPKRLSADECAKVRRRSGPGAYPTLLKPLGR
jgi:hypothetical protein